MSIQLKQFLFNQYGSFADKRIKNIDKSDRFRIDDGDGDDKEYLFCLISVEVKEGNTFDLVLANHPPSNREIERFITAKGGTVTKEADNIMFKVRLRITDAQYIDRLSGLINGLVGPNKRYKNPNWKWLCPRTSASLSKFANILRQFNQ